jgi:hypothetical protein
MEKEKDYENRNFWEAYLELCVLNMFENIKSISMEIETLKYLKKEKEDPNYEDKRNKEISDLRSKKMEIVKLNSVKKIFYYLYTKIIRLMI